MLRLILKRLIFLIPILIGISMISFLITSLSPSDPAEVAIRVNAMVPTPELIAETRSEMGLDRPIAVRWVDWITSALHGDLGRSWVSGRPVAEEFSEAPSIGDHLNNKRTVVLNLESTPKDIARRLVDFLSGVAYANHGTLKRVANSTFIITPYNVDIMGDMLIDELESNGLY